MTPLARCHLLLLACLFLSFQSATAGTATTDSAWSLRVWQSDDDLPNNNVTGIAQTRDSYLWIATQTRLTRFDGDHFENIARRMFAPGTKERVSKLVASHHGGLWMAMDHGPLIYVRAGVVKTFAHGVPDG